MILIIISMLVATSVAAPAAQSLQFRDDGSYRFFYETGKEGGSHTRTEVRGPDGVVIGKFSFEDPDGELREVNYRADETGFVAKGDVGVKGAPKGQFPVPGADHLPQETPAESTSVSEQAEEPKEENTPQQTSEEISDQSPATEEELSVDETEDKDEIQDLAIEETAANDPPEAFPPGFFSEKLTNLRRLPEPTNEGNLATTEPPTAEDNQQSEQPESVEEEKEIEEEVEDVKTVIIETAETDAPAPAPVEGTAYAFSPLKPFPAPGPDGEAAQAIAHHDWASPMFHQPVYVFAYHQPDSYGYHYYF